MDDLKGNVKRQFEKWLIKGEFEKNSDYENRIKNQSASQFNTIVAAKIDEEKKRKLGYSKDVTLDKYNPENETYALLWRGLGYQAPADTAIIKIPSAIALDFSRICTRSSNSTAYLMPLEIGLINNTWQITKGVFLFDNFWGGASGQQFATLNKEKGVYVYEYNNYGLKKYYTIDVFKIKKADDIKREVYFYEWTSPKASSIQPINFNYFDLGITLPEFK